MKQELFYPLYTDFDKEFFNKLNIAIQNKYKFVGNPQNKEKFLKDLFHLQLIKGYRKHLEFVLENLAPETDINLINKNTQNVDFSLDFSWASFKHEKQMIELAQKLNQMDLNIVGSDDDFDEFVLRYLLTIWLADWQGPLYALLIETQLGTLELKKLNEILRLWDFTNLFGFYSVRPA